MARLEMMMDEMAADQAADRPIPDERLRLMFACAHPAIDASARAPLILQTVLGFDARRHRLGLPGVARRHVAKAGAGQAQDPRRGHPLRHTRRRGRGPSVWARCWTPSTPSSPRAGPIRPAPIRARAAWSRRRCSSAA
ncbi:MAG: hypothetical protein WDN45_11900 [Caulobacteraceae bacterium]